MNSDKFTNPFGSGCRYVCLDETDSTMDDARRLAAIPESDPDYMSHGSVVRAHFQRRGRGRLGERKWVSAKGENLLCTVILRMPPPRAFTLRTGLAAAMAFDSFLPAGTNTDIKWPNDVLFDGKKLSGILCETDGNTVFAGTGFNIGQTGFPSEIAAHVTSLAIILKDSGKTAPSPEQFLQRYLEFLKRNLASAMWRRETEKRRYGLGEQTVFISGHPESGERLRGVIEGIGHSGELFFRHETGTLMTLVSGEFSQEM